MSASALSGFSGLHRGLVAHPECSSDGGPGVPSLTSLGDEFGAASGHGSHLFTKFSEVAKDGRFLLVSTAPTHWIEGVSGDDSGPVVARSDSGDALSLCERGIPVRLVPRDDNASLIDLVPPRLGSAVGLEPRWDVSRDANVQGGPVLGVELVDGWAVFHAASVHHQIDNGCKHCNHGCMTSAATSRPIGDPIIFQSTRPAAWPAPEGTTVTVTARKSRNGSIGITWERSDIDTPTTVAVTSEEFAGISAAVSAPSDSSTQKGA